ncbi:DNA internalization-related competence protein ComEC/Rec2 [Pseudodesulfovibrio alkaliphilus]|uniref:DNA internalization-related competence protein ComEC/Rec2 n=1 Tax=Pseudodesulfovibrio alkaliphilus TaxID=2661613 RepID=UPI001E503C77|nr:DNA internalization-related competence protein ComEC/Rec2 [Pseudodesulfovibrio alkaliphilus]
MPWHTCLLALIAGIFASRAPLEGGLALAAVAVADALLRGRVGRLPLPTLFLCAALGLGYALVRTPAQLPAPEWMEAKQPVLVRGVVDRAEPREGRRLRIILREMTVLTDRGETAFPGRLVWNWRNPSYRPVPGQRVETVLRVVPTRGFGNPGGWDYEWYWLRQGVHWRGWVSGKSAPVWSGRPDGTAGTVKAALRGLVAERLPDSPGGGVVLALVTGDRSRIDEPTARSVRAAGLAHTLALSGLHVGFVAALGLGLAWLAGRVRPSLLLHIPRPKLAVLLAAPLVLGYAWLGQPSSSLIRAATMYAFWGALLLQGRGRVLMDGLFFALAAIVAVTPLAVFDLGLQMSALAVAGIGLMYPRFGPRLKNLIAGGAGSRSQGTWRAKARTLGGFALGILAVSLCATISLLPAVSWYFGTLSPNILLNVIWIPVLGFAVMPLGILGMLLAAAPPLASLGGLLLGGAAQITDLLLFLLDATAGAGLTPVYAVLRPLWPETVGFGLLMVVALRVAAASRVVPALTWLAGLGFLLLVGPHAAIMAEDARPVVRLELIDVGLGQAALVTTPGGHRWLTDGGGGSSSFDMGEAVVAPYLTLGRPPRLDGVIMSHPDNDHSRGLSFILSRFEVGVFHTNGMLPGGESGREMRAALAVGGLTPLALEAGQEVDLGGGTRFEVLHPARGFRPRGSNERSLVLRLVAEGQGLAILPGDMERAGTAAVLNSGFDLSAQVLVLPHHGSRSSLSPAFYQAVDARVALCSDGFMNRFDFPHPEVVEALGVPVYATSSHGLVRAMWASDGSLFVHSHYP